MADDATNSGLDFRKVFDALAAPHSILDRDLRIVYANKAYLTVAEKTLDEIKGRYLFDAFPDAEARVASVKAKLLEALGGDTSYLDDQSYVTRHADGSESTHCWRAVQTPVFGPGGEVTHIVQSSEDITEEKALEERAQIISDELDHRVKNMFAIILAIADLTGEEADSVASYREAFNSRLVAMGRTHSALSDNHWTGLDLQQILEAELQQYRAPGGGRITMEGPPLVLSRKSSQDASMITHELATNAAKYGCFSHSDGKLAIRWRIDMETMELCVDWIESGMTGIAPPTREGFGTLLTSMMPNMTIERDFRPEGLAVSIRISTGIAVE